VLNVQGSILKGIYRPVTTLCCIFCTACSENFGSHFIFFFTCGKYKLPAALHFVSRSTALQEIKTLNQQTVRHVSSFSKFLDNYKKIPAQSSILLVTNFNPPFLEVKHIQFHIVSSYAAIFMLKLNCKQRLHRVFKRKSQRSNKVYSILH